MTEAQIVEFARALQRATPYGMPWPMALNVAREMLLYDTTWQDPSACHL